MTGQNGAKQCCTHHAVQHPATTAAALPCPTSHRDSGGTRALVAKSQGAYKVSQALESYVAATLPERHLQPRQSLLLATHSN